LALTLFACGVSGRGLYAVMAFRGPITTISEQWTVNGFGQKKAALSASRTGRPRAIAFPASMEAVAAVTGFGSCITVRIDRSQSGAERLTADQGVIGVQDLTPCPAATLASGSTIQSSRSESPAERSTAAAIRASNERLRIEAEDEAPEQAVSFEPGQPMIDTSPGRE
jgi:hypothetical protein